MAVKKTVMTNCSFAFDEPNLQPERFEKTKSPYRSDSSREIPLEFNQFDYRPNQFSEATAIL